MKVIASATAIVNNDHILRAMTFIARSHEFRNTFGFRETSFKKGIHLVRFVAESNRRSLA